MERVLLICERGPFSPYLGGIFSSFHVCPSALPLPSAEARPAWWMLLQPEYWELCFGSLRSAGSGNSPGQWAVREREHFFKLKQNKTKKEQSILVREKHLESFSLNKVLLWHLDAFIQVKKEFGTFPPRSAGLEEKKQIKRQDHLICCFVLFTWSVVPVDVGWVLLQPTEGLMEESYSVRSRAFFLMRKDNYHANLWSLFTRCI